MNGFTVYVYTSDYPVYDSEGLVHPIVDRYMEMFVDEYALPGRIITFPDLSYWAQSFAASAKINSTVITPQYGTYRDEAEMLAHRQAEDMLSTRDFILNVGQLRRWSTALPTIVHAYEFKLKEVS